MSLLTSSVVAAHGSDHINGGSDEINSELDYRAKGLAKEYNITSDILHSHDAPATITSTTFTKLKTITINTLSPDPVTLRLYWEGKGSEANQGRSQIYKNGVEFGALQGHNTTEYTPKTEDLEFADGDTIELWGKMNAGAGTFYCQNFRVQGEEIEKTVQRSLDTTSIGISDPFSGTNT